jgi:hypothetical protein
MRNTLLFSAIATFVLCAAALADPSSKPPGSTGPPGAGPSQMLRLTLVVKAGSDARTHELSISDSGCGSISDKSAAHEDQIRVCSRPAASGLLIDTDWSTRAGATEYRTRSEMLVARGGGSGEIGRTGGLRLAVTVR